jgi:RNA recognition motif-containing protein
MFPKDRKCNEIDWQVNYLDEPESESLDKESFSLCRVSSGELWECSLNPVDLCPILREIDDEKDKSKFVYSSTMPQYFDELESRTILVSNIQKQTSETEFKEIVSKFGKIHEVDCENLLMGTASVSYYDLRHAHRLRAEGVRGMKVNERAWMIRFAPPTITNTELTAMKKSPKRQLKPSNDGTLVVFQLLPNTSDEALMKVFGEFGDIRQIRKAPSKEKQRFIEFWDLESAEKARDATNHKHFPELGSRISVEFSLPGGMRKNIGACLQDRVPTIERRSTTTMSLVFDCPTRCGRDHSSRL